MTELHRIVLAVGCTIALAILGGATASATKQQQPQNGTERLAPVVGKDERHDSTPPLSSMVSVASIAKSVQPLRPRFQLPGRSISRAALATGATSAYTQAFTSTGGIISNPIVSFDGLSNDDNIAGGAGSVLPPDPNGDVGPNHYVQWVNLSLAIWNKNGELLYGPVQGNTLWAGFGEPCETSNDGDPIALYDGLADRWVMSQFALPSYPDPPFFQCLAVSQTSDPTGSWYRYVFEMENGKLNDYAKLAVWPDGYYMSVNQFQPASGGLIWGGGGAIAFERDKMLAGESARMVYFDLYDVDHAFGGMLPSHLTGPPPPDGSPNYFLEVDDDAWESFPTDSLRLWQFRVDWTNPVSSTFGIDGMPTVVLDTEAFDSNIWSIPQPDSAPGLDAISDNLMYRLQYRNLGDHESLVVNHTVKAGTGRAGIRWYEVRDPGGSPSIYQQGTYSPDTDSRWMGSIAMDGQGNIALGYSVSSTTTYPSIRYTGRLATDPLGTLPQGERELVDGSGVQTYQGSTPSRWGDYSAMSVDPVDDRTFWYTQEYYLTTSERGWRTRIGSFRVPGASASLVVSKDSGDDYPLALPSTAAATSLWDRLFGTLTGWLRFVRRQAAPSRRCAKLRFC